MKRKYCIYAISLVLFTVGFFYKNVLISSTFRSLATLKKQIKHLLIGKKKQTYEVANVRTGSNNLSKSENFYRENRMPIIKACLQNIVEEPLDLLDIPTIAIVGSGGGYRSMLGMVGSLVGMEKIGLLNSVMYIAGLSGSSWATSLWPLSGLPIQEYQDNLLQTIKNGLSDINTSEAQLMFRALAIKFDSGSPVGMSNLFGTLLANRLLKNFGDKRQELSLSDLASAAESGQIILPINVAVDGGPRANLDHPFWYDFTPFEVGSPEDGVFAPTWSVGRTFNQGISTNFAPELSLGDEMAVWGSAFAAHASLIWKNIPFPESLNSLKEKVDKILSQSSLGSKRFVVPKIPNYMQGMPNQLSVNDEYLRLVDGGIGETNLAFSAVSSKLPRNVDIVIFFDWSEIIAGCPALRGIQEYAHHYDLNIPPMEFNDVDKSTISVFQHPTDPKVPVFIYIPRINNQQAWRGELGEKYPNYKHLEHFDIEGCLRPRNECFTGNFTYKNHAKDVVSLAEANVVINKKLITKIIQDVIKRKKVMNEKKGLTTPTQTEPSENTQIIQADPQEAQSGSR